MVKIKTKKQLNLPQLIEWGFENDITNKWYRATDDTEYISEVFFNVSGLPQFSSTVDKSDTFTIEVEEEITEDTHLDYLYALTNDDEKEIRRCMNFTIRNASMVIGRNDLTFFTLVDNDLVKIYENGKLVE